ncbi:hypothetical protein GCM10009867_16250 [Pedococcus aerophilus]|uniref:Uncharacterized protein n=1 Tax=Pedococcus aerophilus TaxID=436356 RepID=A0ABN3ULB1_9MICO
MEAFAKDATVTTMPVAATIPAAAVMMVLLGTVVLPSGVVPGPVAGFSAQSGSGACGRPVP